MNENECNHKEKNDLTCIYCNTTFQHKRYLDDHLRRSLRIIKSRIEQHVQPYINAIEEMKESLNAERLMRERDQHMAKEELKKQIDVLLKGKGNVYNCSQNIVDSTIRKRKFKLYTR